MTQPDKNIEREKTIASQEIGGVLELDESQKKQSEKIDMALLAEYAELTDSADKTADEIYSLYKEIFFEKKIDKEEIKKTILSKANDLLLQAEKELESAAENEKESKTDELIKNFRRQKIVQRKNLEELRQIALNLNELYAGIDQKRIQQFKEKYREYTNGLIKNIQRYYQQFGLDLPDDPKEWNKILVDFHKENPEIDEPDDLYQILYDLDEQSYDFRKDSSLDEEAKKKIEQDEQRRKKYDSARVKQEIEFLEQTYLRDKTGYLPALEIGNKELEEKLKKNLQREFQENEKKFKPLVEKLKKLLRYQINLERKLELIVFGQESADLPPDFTESAEKEILDYQPELGKSDKKTYLPVGISSLLPKEDEIHAKPIDALAYLFWLQNQQEDAELMVVDTIQTTNYTALYNLSDKEARQKALTNGTRDKKWYQAIINVFGLDRIKIKDYQDVENSQEMKKLLESINNLDQGQPREKSQIISRALDNLIEKSIEEKAADKNKEELKKYGKAEIALILTKAGRKISHEKEYRYDILARLILVYSELKKRIKEIEILFANIQERENQEKTAKKIKGLKKEQTLIELGLYLAYYRDFPRSYHLAAELFSIEQRLRYLKSQKTAANQETIKRLWLNASDLRGQIAKFKEKEKEKQEKIKPLNENIRRLQLLEGGSKPEHVIAKWGLLGRGISNREWFRNLQLPDFYYPKAITGLTLEMAAEQRPGFIAFREFYSTYTGESEYELPLEANQVIASTNPLAGAKVLLSDEKNQKKYAEKILEPLLINFYVATSKSKEEAQKRFKNDLGDIATVSDAINLIQRKIVWPIELELKQFGA